MEISCFNSRNLKKNKTPQNRRQGFSKKSSTTWYIIYSSPLGHFLKIEQTLGHQVSFNKFLIENFHYNDQKG